MLLGTIFRNKRKKVFQDLKGFDSMHDAAKNLIFIGSIIHGGMEKEFLYV